MKEEYKLSHLKELKQVYSYYPRSAAEFESGDAV